MSIQRCPECGIRLNTNYCDICMKRVPFKGMPAKQTFQHMEGSSAHRMERGHECVSFEKEEKKRVKIPAPRKGTSVSKKKATSVLAIVVALLGLLPTLFGIVEDRSGAEAVPAPEPVAPYQGSVPAIEPCQIYNDGEIIVVVDCADLYYDDYTVFMTVVNESDEDIIVGTDLLSVNGFMHGSSFYAEVDAGSSVQESLQTYSWEMERDGIKEVAEIAFHLNIYPDDFSDVVQSDLITLHTEAYDTYEQPPFPDGWELYRGEDVAVRLVSYGDNGGNYDLQFYMENWSEDTVSISTETIRINGEETDGYLWNTLRSDTCSRSEAFVSIPGTDHLEEIREITLDLLIEHVDIYEVTDSRTQTVTFYAPN